MRSYNRLGVFRKFRQGFALGLCLALILPAQAQNEGLLRIYEMSLKPEAVDQWTALQRDEAIPALLEGGYDWVEVWESGGAGAGNVYYRSVIMPLDDLADLDEPAIFESVMGPDKARDMIQRYNSMVSSVNALIVRPRQELSFGSPPDTPGVGVLTRVTVENGRIEEFENRLRSSVASELRESNVRSFRVSQVLYGGDANQYFTLLEFESMPNDSQVREPSEAGGHPTPLEWALGTVGVARIAEQPDSPVVSINRVVLRHNNELSTR